VAHWTTVQAGQAFLYNTRQLVKLSPDQLRRCIQSRMHDGLGRQVETCIRNWNGYPIDVSPVAPLLHGLGFRLDGRGWMCWPPRGKPVADPKPLDQDVFLPYFEEPSPVEYGPDWTIGRAAEKLRQALETLLPVIELEFSDAGWDLAWHADGPHATYHGFARMHVRTAASFLQVNFHTRAVKIDGVRHRMAGWHAHEHMRIKDPGDVNKAFLTSLKELMRRAEEITGMWEGQRKRYRG